MLTESSGYSQDGGSVDTLTRPTTERAATKTVTTVPHTEVALARVRSLPGYTDYQERWGSIEAQNGGKVTITKDPEVVFQPLRAGRLDRRLQAGINRHLTPDIRDLHRSGIVLDSRHHVLLFAEEKHTEAIKPDSDVTVPDGLQNSVYHTLRNLGEKIPSGKANRNRSR